jgi:hypothetical protein
MTKKTPLGQVKETHGGKEKLVDKLLGLVDRGEETKEDLKKRLLAAPNSKLLRLHDVLTEIGEKFGGAEKLVDTILGYMNKSKDGDYRTKLLTYSPTRLIDLYRSWHKKGKAA